MKMKIVFCDKARVLRSASNIAINLWDDLDVNVQNAGSFIKFRQLCKGMKVLLTLCYDMIYTTVFYCFFYLEKKHFRENPGLPVLT